MSTVTLSLAKPAARWLDEQVATGRYATADAYLAELVERDRIESERHAALKAAIGEGLASGISNKSFEDNVGKARAEIALALTPTVGARHLRTFVVPTGASLNQSRLIHTLHTAQ